MGNHLPCYPCNPLNFSSFHFKYIPTSVFGCSLVRTRLRPANYYIHCQGQGASDYCRRLVQEQTQFLLEFLSVQIKRPINRAALRHIYVDGLHSASVEVGEMVFKVDIFSSYNTPFNLFVWVHTWRVWCVKRNSGEWMKAHGTSMKVLLLHRQFKSKRKTCGSNRVVNQLLTPFHC